MCYAVGVGFLYARKRIRVHCAKLHFCMTRSVSRGTERVFFAPRRMRSDAPQGTGRVGSDAKKAPVTGWAAGDRQADFGIRSINYRGGHRRQKCRGYLCGCCSWAVNGRSGRNVRQSSGSVPTSAVIPAQGITIRRAILTIPTGGVKNKRLLCPKKGTQQDLLWSVIIRVELW